MANTFGVYMMTQFMKDIPDALVEIVVKNSCRQYGEFKKAISITGPQLFLSVIFNFTGR